MSVARYVGLAEETVYGDADVAQVHVDIASAGLDAPSDTQMVYGGGLQRNPSVHRPGFYAPAGDFNYAFDIHSVGWLLKWALGGYVYTLGGGDVGPPQLNLHEFYGDGDNTLTSFCTRVGKDYFEHIFAGCVVNSLELTVEGEYCNLKCDVVAQKDSKGSIVTVDNLLLPSGYPLAFHEVTASINSVDTSAEIKKLTLSISNNSSADSGRGLASRHPYRVVSGERQTTVGMSLFYEDTSVLEEMWGGATGPVVGGSNDNPIQIVLDSGTMGTMTIDLPAVVYSSVAQTPSGRDEIVQEVAGTAIQGTYTLNDASTVETDIGVRLENENTEYTAA